MEAMTLRAARKRRKLTQKQLEALSGVPQSVISALERGANANVYLSTATSLAKALRFNVANLQFSPAIAHGATE